MKAEHVLTLYRELLLTRTPEEARRATARVLGHPVDALLPGAAVVRASLEEHVLGLHVAVDARTAAHRLSRTDTCPRGHDADDVIVRANGTRTCRPCHREAVRRYEKKRVRCRSRGVRRCRCPGHA